MDYIKNLRLKLVSFVSPLGIKYCTRYNDSIFHLPDILINCPVSNFFQKMFKSYSEKFASEDNFTFYLGHILTILETLQYHEIEFLSNSSENLDFIRSELLSPFTKDFFEASLSSIHSDLEFQFKNLYSHLFLHDEIGILSVLIVKTLLESPDLSNPNFLAKSIPYLNTPSIENGFIFSIEYNKKLIKIVEKNENFKISIFSEDLIDFINTNNNMIDLNKFITSVVNLKVNLIFSSKKIDDKIIKKITDSNIMIIDKFNLEEYYKLINIFEFKQISADFLILSNEEMDCKYKHIKNYSVIVINKNINVRSQNNNSSSITHFLLTDKNQENNCRTLCIKKRIGQIDEERINILKYLIKDSSEKIINILTKGEGNDHGESNKTETSNSLNKMLYGGYYEIIIKKNNKLLTDIINGIDKLILYQFNQVKEEINFKDLKEIRDKVVIKEDLLKECLEIVNILINN